MKTDGIMCTENRKFIIDKAYDTLSLKSLIKRCLLSIQSLYWRMLLILPPVNKSANKKYQISICGIFKNEAPFIKEWIEYHMLLGVEHFYLYNNNSEDNFIQVLQPYITTGIVTLIDWPTIPGQQASYEDFYKKYRHETQWVSFLDLDEFICPLKYLDIPSWLQKFKKYPIIMIYWKMFGTSGHLEHDYSKLVIEQYINSWDKLTDIGKLFYNTDYDICNFFKGMMHSFEVSHLGAHIPPINQYGYFVKYNIHRYNNKEDEIQCNHYWSKAYINYEAKHKRGSAAFGKSWKTFEKFLLHENFNRGSDYSIFRYLIQLKLKMTNKYPKDKKYNYDSI